MYLYDLPQRDTAQRPKIYVDGQYYKETLDSSIAIEYLEFDHLDGMYSLCVAYGADGEKLGLAHLAAATPLETHEDGYRIVVNSD